MRLNNWRHSTIAAGIISGILIGCGATALKHLIALISGLFVSGIHAHGANYILLAVPPVSYTHLTLPTTSRV